MLKVHNFQLPFLITRPISFTFIMLFHWKIFTWLSGWLLKIVQVWEYLLSGGILLKIQRNVCDGLLSNNFFFMTAAIHIMDYMTVANHVLSSYVSLICWSWLGRKTFLSNFTYLMPQICPRYCWVWFRM